MAQWMSDNKLKLNDNNSKVIVFNPSNTETPEHFRTFSICGTDIATKTSVEDLGVYFERNLSIEQQVKAICASCYFHLANIGAIRNSDKSEVESLRDLGFKRPFPLNHVKNITNKAIRRLGTCLM
ncbi:hypothetical protein CAPTEDRAFT_218706 [Capitella teleta]|uniref:Uncharacterized protein n=1 Tax=Capitella teleta TaxID=283909 RepID=R7UYP2_CAPTE|nr:hypothetical protein CAPTEDRAFT_218706 [Capitella teleta]|eukprot:ELU08541.1 hypothetical protein CAPTEDRAFT_218706 [Capitella teleta]